MDPQSKSFGIRLCIFHLPKFSRVAGFFPLSFLPASLPSLTYDSCSFFSSLKTMIQWFSLLGILEDSQSRKDLTIRLLCRKNLSNPDPRGQFLKLDVEIPEDRDRYYLFLFAWFLMYTLYTVNIYWVNELYWVILLSVDLRLSYFKHWHIYLFHLNHFERKIFFFQSPPFQVEYTGHYLYFKKQFGNIFQSTH